MGRRLRRVIGLFTGKTKVPKPEDSHRPIAAPSEALQSGSTTNEVVAAVASSDRVQRSTKTSRETKEPSGTTPGVPIIKKWGLSVLYPVESKSDAAKHTDEVADIVFVHGLRGSSQTTWCHPKSMKHWPRDFLGTSVKQTRILAFDYDADVFDLLDRVSQNRLSNHATNLLGALANLRRRTESEDRKIIFVVHSLGGLLVQKALCSAASSAEEHIAKIGTSTCAIIFLGTPSHGSDLAKWASLGTTMARIIGQPNSAIVEVLRPGSEMLAEVQEGFNSQLRKRTREGSSVDITCFYEELVHSRTGSVIVPMHSAIMPGYPAYGIHADHEEMTKFFNEDDSGYEIIVGEIERFVTPLRSKTVLKKSNRKFVVPFDQDDNFVPQDEYLADIDARLTIQPRVALAGIGGVGKSQIAIEYCYQVRTKYPDTSVFWIYASNADRLDQAYGDISIVLDLPGRDDPKLNIFKLVCDYFNHEDSGSWLIVLDNADDDETFFEARLMAGGLRDNLYDYLPRSSKGKILVTTRDRRIGERLTFRKPVIMVNTLDAKKAAFMLSSKLHKPLDTSDDPTVLLEALENLPLAIAQAAAYINENDTTVSRYHHALTKSDEELSRLLEVDLMDPRRPHHESNSVFRTWRLSFMMIAEKQPHAADLLSLMAVLDGQGISGSLLNEPDDIAVTTALGTLKAFSLIIVSSGKESYGMHRMVQLSTIRWLEITAKIEKWHSEATSLISTRAPSGEFEFWSQWTPLLPHALKVIKYEYEDKKRSLQRATILNNAAWFELRLGRYQSAYTRGKEAMEIRQKWLGDEHEDTIFSKSLLALGLGYRHKMEEAIILQQEIITARENTLGRIAEATLKSLNNLAWMLGKQNKWPEVEVLQREVLEGRKITLGPDHRQTLMAMSGLAKTLGCTGAYEEAVILIKQAQPKVQALLGADHPDVLETMDILAEALRDMGEFSDSETVCRDAMMGHKKVQGLSHPATLLSIARLSKVLQLQKQVAEKKSTKQENGKIINAEACATLQMLQNPQGQEVEIDQQLEEKQAEAAELYETALKGYMESPDRPDSAEVTGLDDLILRLSVMEG